MKCMYDFTVEELIKLKEQRLGDLRSKQWQVITKEDEIRNAESNFIVKNRF